MQAEFDAEKATLNSKINELSVCLERCKQQKEKILSETPQKVCVSVFEALLKIFLY